MDRRPALPEPGRPWASPAHALRVSAAALLCASLLVGTGHEAGPVAAAARQRPAAAECASGWRTMDVPSSALTKAPFALATTGGVPRWALGGSASGNLLLAWDGASWRDAAGRSRGYRGLLGAVTRGPRDLLAVGYRRPDGIRMVPAAGQRVAGAWRQARLPGGLGEDASLTGVVRLGRGRVVAVGMSLSRGRARALVLRRADGTWRRGDPVVDGQSGLTAVARAPDGSAWAVGWRSGTGRRLRPLVASWSGPTARIRQAPSLPAGSAVLTDIAFEPDGTAWVTGYLVRDGASHHVPVLLRREATGWVREAMPWADDVSAVLRSVAVRGGHVWVAGTRLATDERETRGFVAALAEGAWTVRDLDVPADMRSDMRAIVATADGAIAAGGVGATAIVITTCPEDVAPARVRRRIRVEGLRERRRVRPVEDSPERERMPEGGPVPASLASLESPAEIAGVRIRDVTRRVGLADWAPTYGGIAADFDGDGWTDVFYSRHAQLPRLMLGGPDGFTPGPIGGTSFIDRHGCAAADVDGDGAFDVFCAVGRGRGSGLDRHELSLRIGLIDARLARGAMGASDPFGRGRRAAFLRLDRDAAPELFITTAPDRVDGLLAPNRLFRNVDGAFVPAPGVGLDRPVGGACAEAADIDGDRDDDLLVCVVRPDDGRPGGLRVYRNEGGRLRERSGALGIVPIGDVDVVVADVTGDGRPDLVQLARGRLRVSRGSGRSFRRIYEARLSHGVAIAAGDVDRDGRADLYIVRGGRDNAPDRLLVSRDRGRRFVSLPIPQVTGGSGDDVVALDHDRNGRADFLVLNGRPRRGPVKLLASYRAEG